MTDKSNISIVIPTYNRAALLKETIDSCLAQTVSCEIIVVAHGCTDNTDDIVASYGERVQYVKRIKDSGPHFCWLDGVLHTSGKYVHLHFDDDLMQPTFIESCMKLMHDDVGFVFSAVSIFDTVKNTQTPSLDNLFEKTDIYKISKIEKILMKTLISPAAVIYRKQDLVDALYQGNTPLGSNHYHGVGPDCFATLICLLRYPKFGYVKDKLALFRAHTGSITIDAHSDKKKKKKIKAAYKDIRNYYKGLKLLQTKQKIIKYATLGLIK
jgi:glycosyltransferase involved in cell wall biosynthesis